MSGVIVSDPERKLLVSLVEKGVERLEPKILPEGVQYNDIEYTDADWQRPINILTELTEKGLLEKEDYDRVLLCPTCDSPHVYSKYACPTDRSIFIKKVTLLRHETDGFSGELEQFNKHGHIVCPKCKQDLGDIDEKETWDPTLKEIGYSFQCEHNGHRFERPLVIHFCPVCGSTFDYRTARYISMYAYTLSQKAYDLVKQSADTGKLVKPVVDFLKKSGLEIRYNVEIKGVSGSIHKFDLTASIGNSLLVVDYSFGESPKLVSLLGKKLDIPGVEAALIDFSDNDELLNLGKVYNIPIIDTGKNNWSNTLTATIENMKKIPIEKKEETRRKLWERKKN